MCYRSMEAAAGIEPTNTCFADRPLEPLGYAARNFRCESMGMETIVARVVRRFVALKYVPKEKKKSKVERISKFIREKTGLSNSLADKVADALMGNRDILDLARQKGLPVKEEEVEVSDGEFETKAMIKGPKGSVSVEDVKAKL